MSARFSRHVPQGDNRERLVCQDCGFINYENPKVVVGTVSSHEGRVLMCRRAIEPRRGYWTLPAGYLESREGTMAGALRETREEANADVEIEGLLAVYEVVRVSQVQLFYRARLPTPTFSAGPESLDVALVEWEDIPWSELAFPTVAWALNDWHRSRHLRDVPVHTNPPDATGALPEFVAQQQRDADVSDKTRPR